MRFKRIFIAVADSVGCGYEPKSKLYGDEGANTIGHIAQVCGGITLPTLEKMGYGNITEINGVAKNPKPIASFGKALEKSTGKDTMTGHWEMMGIYTTKPFQTFTDTGFPQELIAELEAKTGHKVIGNIAASGTEIIKELGLQHIKDNSMIVYTSADSVLQIAAHEKYFGLDELYRCCEIAREICMKPEWKVGRVIARPFLGETPESFKRTTNRHDYALSPSYKTALDTLKDNGFDVLAIGKINDIFNGAGITSTVHTVSNHNGMEYMTDYAKNTDFTGLCFLNLVDFDALYGHRRDPAGYKACLEEFDKDIAEFIKYMKSDDLLIITADHGNDPTWTGTDHTREYIPIIAYSTQNMSTNLGIRTTFGDLGQTVLDNFGLQKNEIGTSFLGELK